MNPVIEVGAAAVIVRSLVAELKQAGVVMSSTATVVVSLILNFLVLMAMAVSEAVISGQPVSIPFLQSLASMVVAAVYNDWRSNLKS